MTDDPFPIDKPELADEAYRQLLARRQADLKTAEFQVANLREIRDSQEAMLVTCRETIESQAAEIARLRDGLEKLANEYDYIAGRFDSDGAYFVHPAAFARQILEEGK